MVRVLERIVEKRLQFWIGSKKDRTLTVYRGFNPSIIYLQTPLFGGNILEPMCLLIMRSSWGVFQNLLHLIGASDVEGCDAATVGQVGIGTVADEKPDDLGLPAVDGPAQRRLKLGIAGVDGGAMIE